MTLQTNRLFQKQLMVALLAASAAYGLTGQAFAQAVKISSPDGQVSATVSPDAASTTFQVTYKGKTVISPSTLGITVDGQNLATGAAFGTAATRTFRETYPTRGVHPVATNSFNEAVVPVTSGAGKTPWQLELRAFNDGFAYRYRVPLQGTHQINTESSQWKLPANSVLWYQINTNEYETAFREMVANRVASGQTIGAPVTAKLADGLGYALITEANLVDYSDMALGTGEAGTFNAVFNKNPQGWSNEGDIVSPWRVTMVVPDLNGLVNSDLITNLCPPPPPELANAAWIKPGRSNWHWLVTYGPRLEQQRQWVDWTQQLGFEYYLIDDGWVNWRADGKDQWQLMKEIVDYGKTKNVAIWAWVHSKEIRTHADRESYFQKAKAAGIVGLKMDFPERPDVNWVNWYDETLRDMAKYQLMANFHGAVKPSGRERTWPHELTRESIFGRESGKLPAMHDTALPFTRYIQGPADFTPTDFRLNKLNGSSWAHELAQAVVYTSPFYCYGGDPADYLANAAVDIVKALPATWDETIVLPGSEVGRTAAFARRKGNEWFIGVVNGSESKPFTVNLGFLGAGRFSMDKLADKADNNGAWDRTKASVTNKSSFTVQLRGDGGFVGRIQPIG
ncbi:glycoside hydrolase family 97 [bacterium]|nr:MAG: glycoside hydrolase family 97 [bacterium]